jgi:hypothetical protein
MQRTEACILCRHLGKGPWYGEMGLTTEEEGGVFKSGYLHWVRILGVDGNSYCNDRRDLDLCRDAALLEHDWRCVIPQCGQPYDRSWIENTLLQIVRQRERLFHLQDLVCSKCCQVHHSIVSV